MRGGRAIAEVDPVMSRLLAGEEHRQKTTLMLIASENHPSRAVMLAQASFAGSKYAEGYPKARYYQGQEVVDQIELLAQARAKDLFKVPYVNVQPYSGSPANLAAYKALMDPGETLMGLNLSAGGHLTHGAKISATSQYYESVSYGVTPDGWIDYDEVAKLAHEHRPKVIVAGTTAYARRLDWQRFSNIAESVDAYLMADIAHVAGLIAGGAYPSPVDYAHIITTTTHKTLRGPRGAMIMVTEQGLARDPELSKKVDKAVFPGLQGGPHLHTIAAIGIALTEAQHPNFQDYAGNVVHNAEKLGVELNSQGFNLVTGGTDSHLLLIDVTTMGISGRTMAEALEQAGLVANYNAIPFDTRPPLHPSGLRVGTAAITSRDMGPSEMSDVAEWFGVIAEEAAAAKKRVGLSESDERKAADRHEIIKRVTAIRQIRSDVRDLAHDYPIPDRYI